PGVRLHAPNALHVRFLEPGICRMLKRAGLVTVRLGLETGDFSRRLDTKLNCSQWRLGVGSLLEAGFSRKDIRVYVLAGLPGGPETGILSAVQLCREFGLQPELNYYSPIPGTPMFRQAELSSSYPLEDPLCHNVSIWPCVPGGFSWEEHKRWKRVCLTGQ
ncbi:MAG: B12-binding domain-containing radical SAM protein, partial [Desulfonatronovibrionaceae bacterium]